MNRLLSIIILCMLQVTIGLAATFELKVTMTPEGAASLNTTGGTFEAGAKINLRTDAHTGFLFKGWYEGSTLLSANNRFDYSMPSHDATVVARYEYDPTVPDNPSMPDTTSYFTLKTQISPQGAGTVNITEGKYAAGTNVNLRAYSNTGYIFRKWQDINGASVSEAGSFDFSMPRHDVQFTAIYEYDPVTPANPDSMGVKYNVIVEPKPTGGGTFNNANFTLEAGSSMHLYAYTNTGYVFLHWEDEDGHIISEEQNFYYVVPNRDSRIYGVYEFDPALPTNPGRNYWNKETGEVIVDDFTTGQLGRAVDEVINGSDRSLVTMITAVGVINNNDFGIANNYGHCTLVDLSRTTGMSAVPSYIYDYNTSLTQIVLPACIERLERRAFYQATSLTTIKCYAVTPPSVESEALTGIAADAVAFVPASSISMYQEAEGWKNLTLLPLAEDVSNLKVCLPEGTDLKAYENMQLELVNTKSGQRYRYLLTDRQSYTFSGLIHHTSYNVFLKTNTGSILGEINDVKIETEDVTVTFNKLLALYDAGVVIQKPDGTNVTDHTLCTWYDQDNNRIGQGPIMKSQVDGSRLCCVVALDQVLGVLYQQPKEVMIEINGRHKQQSVSLETFNIDSLEVLALDADSRNALPFASLFVKQTLNDQYDVSSLIKTDKNGVAKIPFVKNQPGEVVLSTMNYVSQTRSLVDWQKEWSLKPVSGVTINLNLSFTTSVESGKDPEVQAEYEDYRNVTYSIFDKTAHKEILEYNLQFPQIVLTDPIEEGHELIVTAKSLNNTFRPAEGSGTIDSQKKANISIKLVEFGGLDASFTSTNAESVMGLLYDQNGQLVQRCIFSGNRLNLRKIPDGIYHLVTIGQCDIFNGISNLSELSAAGLIAETDYLINQVQIISGQIKTLDILDVPKIDESKFYYTNENTYFSSNKNKVTAGDYLTLRSILEFKTIYADDICDISLFVDIPLNSALVDNSIMVGSNLSNYSLEGNRVIIPIDDMGQQIRFCIIPTESGRMTSSAYVQFTLDGRLIQQPIGSVIFDVSNLSINVPETTINKTVTLGGQAIGNSIVSVYDNGSLIGQTKALPNGMWGGTFELKNPTAYTIHKIQVNATMPNGLTILSETKKCIYDPNAIVVKSVTMYNTAHTAANLDLYEFKTVFDMLNPSKQSPTYWYWPNYPDFTFEIDFTNNDTVMIKDVHLHVLTSSGKIEELIPSYDEHLDRFVASAPFYSTSLPINVSVDYEYYADINNDFTEIQGQEIQNIYQYQEESAEYCSHNESFELESQLEDADVYKVIDNLTGDDYLYTFQKLNYNEVYAMMNAVQFHFAELDEGGYYAFYSKIEEDEINVYIVFTEEELAYLFKISSPESGNLTHRAPQKSSFTPWKWSVKGMELYDQGIQYVTYGSYFLEIPYIYSIFNLWDTYKYNVVKDIEKLQEILSYNCSDGNPALPENERVFLTKEISFISSSIHEFDYTVETLYYDYLLAITSSLCYEYTVGKFIDWISHGLTFGGKMFKELKNSPNFAKVATVYGTKGNTIMRKTWENEFKLMLEKTIDKTEKISGPLEWKDFEKKGHRLEQFMDTWMNNIQGKMKMVLKNIKNHARCQLPYNLDFLTGPNACYVMDPSGYVYEAVPSNRVEGATATAYYKEEVEDMYGDVHEEIVLWDAEEYAQENPLFTDENGMYAWDVPQGLWQVKLEKEGYQNTYSEWLPVPPPQLDVNLPMSQYIQPQVSEAHAYQDAFEIVFDKYMLPDLLTTDNIIVQQGDSIIRGSIVWVDAETAPTGEQYVRHIKFVPSDSLSAAKEALLTVSRRVKSYAGVTLESDFQQSFSVKRRIKLEADSTFFVPYGGHRTYTMQATPVDLSAGQKVAVSSSVGTIAALDADTLTFDANGRAQLRIDGSLPGSSTMRFQVIDDNASSSSILSVAKMHLDAPIANYKTGTKLVKDAHIILSTTEDVDFIYFTIDGSSPSAHDTSTTRQQYTEPLAMTSADSLVLKTLAEKYGIESPVASYVYYATDGQGIDIVTADGKSGEIMVYDLLGNLLFSIDNASSLVTRIHEEGLKGTFILRLSTKQKFNKMINIK